MRAAVLAFAAAASGYDEFRMLLPNGQRLAALGHESATGGGPRNAFGRAFAAAGFEWTEGLCRADSDGDGQSNGFELGDACCCWDARDAWALAQAPFFPDGGGENTGHVFAYSKHKIGDLPRNHDISLPGDAASTSAAAPDAGADCDCAAVAAAAAAALAASAAEKARRSGVVPFDVATVPVANLVAGASLAVALAVAALHPAFGARRFLRALGVSGAVQLFLASALYIDVTGLLLHLVLDNVANERHALLAGGVRSFVNHHADPQKIAATPGLHYAFTHLGVGARRRARDAPAGARRLGDVVELARPARARPPCARGGGARRKKARRAADGASSEDVGTAPKV